MTDATTGGTATRMADSVVFRHLWTAPALDGTFAERHRLSEGEGRHVGLAGRAERSAERADEEQELRIPLMREEMDVEKFSRESGHVKIHKAVHVEEKHFSIPLRREELVIEHIAGPVREGALHEIKSPLILQPGPAALTDGLDQLVRIVAEWAATRA